MDDKMNNDWSLVPLSKIINAHTQISRILWSIFSVTMVVGLVISIFLTVHRYMDHATVFRMDYSTANYVNDLPAIMICHNAHRVGNLVNHSQVSESIINYEIKSSEWSTKEAHSQIYHKLKNYTVQFSINPTQPLQLGIVEQFPRPNDQLCIDFELTAAHNKTSNILHIRLQQDQPLNSDYYEVVVHNKQTFPLNNYERFLYLRLKPGENVFLFTSKQITSHLNTVRNGCAQSPLEILGRNFSYDQTVCQWKHVCESLQQQCQCDCALNVLGAIHSPCSQRCLQRFSRALVNTSTCPQSCSKTKYSELNKVTLDAENRESTTLIIIRSNLVTMAIEEPIYTLAKMFSEIGGLSSLLFGVSCIIVFEVLEKILQSARLVRLRSASLIPLETENNAFQLVNSRFVGQYSFNSISDSPSFILSNYSARTKSSTIGNDNSNNNNNTNFKSDSISNSSIQYYPIEVIIDKISFTSQMICESINLSI